MKIEPRENAVDKAVEAFEESVRALPALYDTVPQQIVCDLHPDYASTVWAKKQSARVIEVQHHHAHILSVMAEHDLRGDVLGVSWDGTGFGTDGTIWGGEFLIANENRFERFAYFRPFPLPGGEIAVKEPRRCALGLMFTAHGDAAFENDPWSLRKLFTDAEWATLRSMLSRDINCPKTSSAGRIFDAVASLLGIRQRTAYEGQAAMLVEFAAGKSSAHESAAVRNAAATIDWQPMIESIADAMRKLPMIGNSDRDNFQSLEVAKLAAEFHGWLVAVIVEIAKRAKLPRVCLGGGCFQNARLLEGAIASLRREGFEVFWPREVPANDGGLALGQAWFALNREESK